MGQAGCVEVSQACPPVPSGAGCRGRCGCVESHAFAGWGSQVFADASPSTAMEAPMPYFAARPEQVGKQSSNPDDRILGPGEIVRMHDELWAKELALEAMRKESTDYMIQALERQVSEGRLERQVSDDSRTTTRTPAAKRMSPRREGRDLLNWEGDYVASLLSELNQDLPRNLDGRAGDAPQPAGTAEEEADADGCYADGSCAMVHSYTAPTCSPGRVQARAAAAKAVPRSLSHLGCARPGSPNRLQTPSRGFWRARPRAKSRSAHSIPVGHQRTI